MHAILFNQTRKQAEHVTKDGLVTGQTKIISGFNLPMATETLRNTCKHANKIVSYADRRLLLTARLDEALCFPDYWKMMFGHSIGHTQL